MPAPPFSTHPPMTIGAADGAVRIGGYALPLVAGCPRKIIEGSLARLCRSMLQRGRAHECMSS